jgi:hypothetical protein
LKLKKKECAAIASKILVCTIPVFYLWLDFGKKIDCNEFSNHPCVWVWLPMAYVAAIFQ